MKQSAKLTKEVRVYFFLFAILCSKIAKAQSTSTLMGGRAVGMAYASSTLADEWSLFNNIGGLGKINQINTAFAYEARPALSGANRLAASLLMPSRIGAWGLSVFRFGDDVYSEHIASLGFGNQIGNTTLGTKVNYIQYRAEGFGVNTAVSIDFGGITQITPQISVGAYINNLTQSKLNTINNERLPTRLTAGVGFRPSEKVFVATEIEKDLDYSPSWRSGLEYSIYKKVFFRTGFNLNPNAAFFGMGAQKKNLKFDYALRFGQLVGTAHHVSAVYFLAKNKK